MMHRAIAILLSPPRLILLLFVLLLPTASKTTITVVHAFSPATTATVQQQHPRPRYMYLNSRLNLFGFGRRKHEAEYNNGKDNNNTDNNEGLSSVKKLDSFPARAKQLRNDRLTKNEEDRHAWKNKDKKNNKHPAIEKALYKWRGLAQKLRYAIHRNTIYVLECENGKYYVGSTKNRKQRYREHFDIPNKRRGSKWTRIHKPIRVVAEYKRIPSRYLMGMESQKTSEWMFEHGVNNVRGAGYCLVKDFTMDDLAGLTTFLGHYNQLNYDSLGMELEKVLPMPYVKPAPKKPKLKKKRRSPSSPNDPNMTQLTNKDVAAMTSSFNNRNKERNFNNKKRRKERKLKKERGETNCYKCGEPGHWASECPNEEETSPASDGASYSSEFANRWESNTDATSYDLMDSAESVAIRYGLMDDAEAESVTSENTASES